MSSSMSCSALIRAKQTRSLLPLFLWKPDRVSSLGSSVDQVSVGFGDVVVKLGDIEVPDMMGYMKALAAFEKGDTAPIVVLRDGKEHKTEVTF